MTTTNRMKVCCLSVLAVSFGAIPLAPCMAADIDTIDTMSDDGETIIMQSGQVYNSDDPITSGSWQPGDNVVITNDDKIVNTDQGGESVGGMPE